VVADFTGGEVTSDAGGLLLREVAEGSRILRRFADCFVDHRDPELIEHSVLELVAQRTYAVALLRGRQRPRRLRRDHCWRPWWARPT
jgi:hypothetical protein